MIHNHLLKMPALANLINADLERSLACAEVVEKHACKADRVMVVSPMVDKYAGAAAKDVDIETDTNRQQFSIVSPVFSSPFLLFIIHRHLATGS